MTDGKPTNVERWLKSVSGSKQTERNYQRSINKFFDHCGVDAEEVIIKWKKVKYKSWKLREKFVDEWNEKLQDYNLSLKGYAPLSKEALVTPVISFFKFYDIKLKHTKMKHPFVKYGNRSIKKEEIRRILDHANLRDKTFYLLALETGLRPDTLVQLQYKHIKEDFQKGGVKLGGATTIHIQVPPELLKDRVGHRISFIGTDAFTTLKQYLSSRMPLKDNDYLFEPIKPLRGDEPHISRSAFTTSFGRLVLKLKIDTPREKGKPRRITLYSLRKYFRNNIGLDTKVREYFMGHSLGTDTFYIDRDNIEKYREMYAEAYPNIRIYQPEAEVNLEELKEKIREELRAEYDQKLEKQVREIIKEEMRQTVETDPQTRYIVEDFVQAQLNVKPERVSFSVALSENNTKTITVLGYWKDGKYVRLTQPAKITKH